MAVEMTYVALRPLRVGGETRGEGELVPEAESWHNVGAYLSTGKLAAVPKSKLDSQELAAAEERYAASRPDPEPEEKPEPEPEPEPQGEPQYSDLTADEVKEQVTNGSLDADRALELELERERPRKGVLDFLESLEDEGEE